MLMCFGVKIAFPPFQVCRDVELAYFFMLPVHCLYRASTERALRILGLFAAYLSRSLLVMLTVCVLFSGRMRCVTTLAVCALHSFCEEGVANYHRGPRNTRKALSRAGIVFLFMESTTL